MDDQKKGLQRAIERAMGGGYREYWLQFYVRDNFKKWGFTSLEGPFSTGYDFRGIYKGKQVVVEAERTPRNFVEHGHNPHEVDFLIVEADDDTDRILLPKNIIVVDPEDFVKQTYEWRRDYAIEARKRREAQEAQMESPFFRVREAIGTLWMLLAEVKQEVFEGTPESEGFGEALDRVSIAYLKALDEESIKRLREPGTFTKIEVLANKVAKSRGALTESELDYCGYWLGFLVEEFQRGL